MPVKPPTFGSKTSAARNRAYDDRRALNPELSQAKRIRSSITWQRCRKFFLSTNPVCCNPFKEPNHIAPAQEVHHIKPLGKHPELAYDAQNLAALCVPCHVKIEQEERAGRNTEILFHG